uniref:Ovule protein n=1 Tax=Brugia timori TaxID=42155 RepID=A0A0R3QJV7_9BILA
LVGSIEKRNMNRCVVVLWFLHLVIMCGASLLTPTITAILSILSTYLFGSLST